MLCLITQSCPTLCDPMDCRPSGSFVHGILQTRILEWIAMPSSRGSPQPRDLTQVSHIACGFFIIWATRKAQEYWSGWPIPSPVDLPHPGIEPGSPALQADSLPADLYNTYIFIYTIHVWVYIDAYVLVLGSQQNWVGNTEFSYILCPLIQARSLPPWTSHIKVVHFSYNWRTYTDTSLSTKSTDDIRVHP